MSVKSKEKNNIGLDKKRLTNSFKYAFNGIISAYKDEQNIKIHTIVAVLVLIFGFILKLHKIEFIICLILIGLVLMAEFFNTAIENAVDLVTLEENKYAKIAKDTAAAGVLVFTGISAVIGLIIFIPKIITFIGGLL